MRREAVHWYHALLSFSMSSISNSTRRIYEERQLYVSMMGELEGAMFPELSQAAAKIVSILETVADMTFEDVVVNGFLDRVSALRKTLQRTQQKVETSRWSYPDGTQMHAASRQEVRSMISSSEVLQARTRDLLRAIGQVQKRARRSWPPKGPLVYRMVDSILRIRGDGNTVLNDMADRIRDAHAAFENRASLDIIECIANILDRQQRKDQFQSAEELAKFVERVTSGAGSARSTDDALRIPEAVARMRADIASDICHWLSSGKRVYCLSGEPETGKTRIALGVCGLLSTELASKATLGASFFISQSDKDLKSFRFALLSVSYQVSPEPRAYILDKVREYLYRGEDGQLRNAAMDLLHTSLAAASPFALTPTVLVFDAVDHSEESDDIPGLLRRLLSFLNEFPWLFLFLSTRPRPNVMAALTHSDVAELVHHHRLDDNSGGWSRDPGRHLRYAVLAIPAYNYLQRSPGDLVQLIQLVGGDVVFGKLAARYLDAGAAPDQSQIRLRRLLSMAASDSPLQALYMEQTESVGSVPSPDQHTCLRTLLRFVAQTGCGLTPEEISTYAHAISADDVAIMVDDLRAVLTINCDGKIVPHDVSFSQFLLDMRAVSRLPTSLLF